MLISSVFSGIALTTFSLMSPSIQPQAPIPSEFTCKGVDISPKLMWQGAPQGTKCFALTLRDPDAPSGDFIHWIIYNIPASTEYLPAELPKSPTLENGTMQGVNGFGSIGYSGPCPPFSQTHEYIFTLYALDSLLPHRPEVSYSDLQNSMKGHILSETRLIGRFSN